MENRILLRAHNINKNYHWYWTFLFPSYEIGTIALNYPCITQILQGADDGYIKGVDSLLDLVPTTEDERIYEAAITNDALLITDLMR